MEVPVSVCCVSLVWSVKFKITFSEVACVAYSKLGSFGWFTVFFFFLLLTKVIIASLIISYLYSSMNFQSMVQMNKNIAFKIFFL